LKKLILNIWDVALFTNINVLLTTVYCGEKTNCYVKFSNAYLILTPPLVPEAVHRIAGVLENQEFVMQIKPFFENATLFADKIDIQTLISF